MTNRWSAPHRVLLGILAITCFGRTAAAQSIDEVVHPGRVVRVDDRDGHILTGKVFRVSAQTLELMVGGHTETIPVGRIWSVRVQYKDPISDGARKGALTGLVIGAAFGVIGAMSTCGEQPQFINLCSAGDATVVAAVFGAYGAGIGAASGLIGDALLPSYRVVWRAPVTSKIAFSVTRLPRGTGAALSFRW
jgi:hypothetical protein